MSTRGTLNQHSNTSNTEREKPMSKKPDPYASEEDTLVLLRKDTRTPAERELDRMLEERGASEQGAEPFLILRQIALELMAERKSLMQLFTDPENQPTQHGTVTVEYMQREISAELEACAKICDQAAGNYFPTMREAASAAKHCATVIRARAGDTA